MSTSRSRIGDSDFRTDPLLTIHLVILGIEIIVYLGLSYYSQSNLLYLYRRTTSIKLIGHPHGITLVVILTVIYLLNLILKFVANVSFYTCRISGLLIQFILASMVAIVANRWLYFLKRFSQVQCRKYFVAKGVIDLYTDDQFKKIKNDSVQLASRIVKTLTTRRIFSLTCLTFLASFCLAFLDKNYVEEVYKGRNPELCAIGFIGTMSLLWPILTVTWIFILNLYFKGAKDPYYYAYKLKIEVFTILLVFLASLFLRALLESRIGTAHTFLILGSLSVILGLGVWYAESYLPLKLTKNAIRKAASGHGHIGPGLIDTIANPSLLGKFEEHLVNEWSLENLEFYKATILFQLHGKHALKRINEAMFPILNAPKRPTEDESMRRRSSSEIIATTTSVEDIKIALSVLKEAVRSIRLSAWTIYSNFLDPEARQGINLRSKEAEFLQQYFRSSTFHGFANKSSRKPGHEPLAAIFVDKKIQRKSREIISNGNRESHRSHSPSEAGLSLSPPLWHPILGNAELKLEPRVEPERLKSRHMVSISGTPSVVKQEITEDRKSSPLNRNSNEQAFGNKSSIKSALSLTKETGNTPFIEGTKPLSTHSKSTPNSNQNTKSRTPEQASLITRLQANKAFCAVINEASADDEAEPFKLSPAKLLSVLDRDTAAKFLSLYTAFVECSNVFEGTRKEIFHLMESDSHRRFVLKLHREDADALMMTTTHNRRGTL